MNSIIDQGPDYVTIRNAQTTLAGNSIVVIPGIIGIPLPRYTFSIAYESETTVSIEDTASPHPVIVVIHLDFLR